MADNALTETVQQALAAKEAAAVMETVVADGDLGKLSAPQRLRYYLDTCKSLGLNPYTRPFEYVRLNNRLVLYARRDCADQLRNLRGISLQVVDKRIDEDLFIVTVRATDSKGRSDEDFGAVMLGGLKGEVRANAMLKAITKAKRRVTLSICGLGMSDETEVDDIPGAEKIRDAMPIIEGSADIQRPPVQPTRSMRQLVAEIVAKAGQTQSFEALSMLETEPDTQRVLARGDDSDAAKAVRKAINAAHDRIAAMHAEATPAEEDAGWPGPKIENEERLASG